MPVDQKRHLEAGGTGGILRRILICEVNNKFWTRGSKQTTSQQRAEERGGSSEDVFREGGFRRDEQVLQDFTSLQINTCSAKLLHCPSPTYHPPNRPLATIRHQKINTLYAAS